MTNKNNNYIWIGIAVVVVVVLAIVLISNSNSNSSNEKSFDFILRPNDILISDAEREYGLREDIELNFASNLCYDKFVEDYLPAYDLQQISSNPEDWKCMIENLEFSEGYLKGEGLKMFEEKEYSYVNYAINCECWKK